jgi:uncharacterized coiled-coil DUF342 family protein
MKLSEEVRDGMRYTGAGDHIEDDWADRIAALEKELEEAQETIKSQNRIDIEAQKVRTRLRNERDQLRDAVRALAEETMIHSDPQVYHDLPKKLVALVTSNAEQPAQDSPS